MISKISNPTFKIANTPFKNIRLTRTENRETKNLQDVCNYYHFPKIAFRGLGQEYSKNQLAKAKEFLDNTEFTIVTSNGEKIKSTIKNYIASCAHNIKPNVTIKSLVHGTSREACENIIQNKFDFSRISRTKSGPGICFGTEGLALDVGGSTFALCDFEGTIGEFTSNMYCAIKENENIRMPLSKILGLETNPENLDFNFSECMQNYEKSGKFLDNYVRELIVNKLKIDGSIDQGTSSNPGCFVVYNPNSILNIRAKL